MITSQGRPHSVVALELTAGLVSRVYILTNPDKLGGVAPQRR